MRTVLVAAGAGLVFTLLATPLFIRMLVRQGYGQLDPRRRADEPPHQARARRPWAGLVVIVAVVLSYGLAHLRDADPAHVVRGPRPVPHDRARARWASPTTPPRSATSAASG